MAPEVTIRGCRFTNQLSGGRSWLNEAAGGLNSKAGVVGGIGKGRRDRNLLFTRRIRVRVWLGPRVCTIIIARRKSRTSMEIPPVGCRRRGCNRAISAFFSHNSLMVVGNAIGRGSPFPFFSFFLLGGGGLEFKEDIVGDDVSL